MNLLDTLNKEIIDKKITNKLDIARYIYKRTGTLFKYDSLWYFSTPLEKETLKNKNVNLINVTNFNITSASWANMYNELLHNFGIVSRIKSVEVKLYDSTTSNYYIENIGSEVEILIDGQIFVADLTKNLNDLVALKFGLSPSYDCKTRFEIEKNNTNNLNQLKKSEKINKIKQMLDIIKTQEHLNDEEFNYQVFRAIQNNVDFSKPNVGFPEGKIYIDLLLKTIIGDYYMSNNICFYNKENNKYISLYVVPLNGINQYFSYETGPSGLYKFHDIPKETIDFYFQNYEYVLSDSLKSIVNINSNQSLNSVSSYKSK